MIAQEPMESHTRGPDRSVEPSSVPVGTFASLAVRDYLFLWISIICSTFAMNMQIVARGWLAYDITGSAVQLVWITLAFTLPQGLFSLFGGALADRWNKKKLMIGATSVNFIASLVMAFAIYSGRVTIMDFILLGIVNGTVLAMGLPARTAIIPELVGERLVFNAVALRTVCFNISRILAPSLAGLIIAFVGAGVSGPFVGVGICYFVIAALYLVAVLTIFFIRNGGEPGEAERSGVLREIAAGLRYVKNSPVVLGLLLLSMVPYLLGINIITTFPDHKTFLKRPGVGIQTG